MFVIGENICVFPWRPAGMFLAALVPSRAEGSFRSRRAGQRAPGWSRGVVAGAGWATLGKVTLPVCTTAGRLVGSSPQAGATLTPYNNTDTLHAVRVQGPGWWSRSAGHGDSRDVPGLPCPCLCLQQHPADCSAEFLLSKAGNALPSWQPEELLAMPVTVQP